jgi:hypothetical protein
MTAKIKSALICIINFSIFEKPKYLLLKDTLSGND